jgi:capsular polysaccharide transport system permease protein
VRPVARSARLRRRHRATLISFALMVIVPVVIAAGYLHTRAVDQYTSTVGFAVRTQQANPSIDLLGGLASSLAGSSSSSDTDILNHFIHSQALVTKIDADLDLRALYSAPYDRDPVFAFDPDGSVEDLVDYWADMVKIFYDHGTGLIELQVHAYDPVSARTIAQAILEESTQMINDLSAIARDDTTRYAREELDATMARLKAAREAMTAFRSRTRIVDPSADLQSQMGVIGTLQQQLAGSLIELDLLRDSTRADDPRVTQAERRIEVIRARIDTERQKFSLGGADASGEDYASIMAEYERLTVDREFAQRAYTGALVAYDAALAEARRKSRYLAAYVSPTLSQEAQYPERGILVLLVGFFALLIWTVSVLVWYAIRDRR